jgi:hypothetical protein
MRLTLGDEAVVTTSAASLEEGQPVVIAEAKSPGAI